MNPFGSYKRLLGNSVAALSAAIEIYNKPKIDYRDETFVILLVNGWELALKALLSKNRQRIFYPKKRNEPYKTYSVSEALRRSQKLFPKSVDYKATVANLEHLITFRDNVIHFYNEPGIGVLVYALAQTAIVNYRDLLLQSFEYDLSREITLSLLPLALAAPMDPIQFLNAKAGKASTSPAVQQFCDRMKEVVKNLEAHKHDTGRFMTVFQVYLQSTKKLESSDLVIGIDGKASGGSVLVEKRIDPNTSYPFQQKHIISSRSNSAQKGLGLVVGGHMLTSHVFQKVVSYYGFKEDFKYCWMDENGALTKYSHSLVERLKALTKDEVNAALNA